jgi:hypothetical protein
MNRSGVSRIRSSRWLPVVGFGLLLLVVPSLLAASGALRLQVVAAAAGALMAAGGVSLMRVAWPHRRRSDIHHLLAALGFFLSCAGAVTMLAGVGLYH